MLQKFARHQEACRKAGIVTFDAKAGFDPEQPRDERGRWSDSGGAGSGLDSGTTGGGITDPRVISDATSDNDWKPGAQYAQAESRRYSVVLEDEPAFAHISEHIDRSDAELVERLQKNYYRGITVYGFEEAQGSFADVRSANDFVNRTLEENRAVVDLVASGERGQATVEKRFGHPTGKEMFRPDVDSRPYRRTTYSVRVVIRNDSSMKNGYRIVTAFPINRLRTR